MKFKTIIKYALTTVSIIVILIILLIYFTATDSKKRLAIKLDNPTKFIHTTPKNYDQLLKVDSKLRLLMTTYSKHRNPITEFFYDEDYFLDIYKLGRSDTLSMNNILEEFDTKYANIGEEYEGNFSSDKTLFFMGSKVGRPDSIEKICVNIEGRNTHIIKKNEYMAYYSSHFNTFSIRNHKEDNDKEFFGFMKPENENFYLPLEMMLLKKPDGIYLIILTVIDKSTKIKEGMLLNLLNGQNIKE